MKRADAPPPGWYPDPSGGTQLRWWDGLDWTDRRRAPPNPAVPDESEPHEPSGGHPSDGARERSRRSGAVVSTRPRDQTAELMAEARRVAREEIDRAVDRLASEARDATRRLEPLISQYGDRAMRWVRNAALLVVALLALWIIVQAVAQTSLLNWIGDRIDNLTSAGSTVVAYRGL